MRSIAGILASPARSKVDRAKDAERRATDTLIAAQLNSEQTILELEPGRGWFTTILLQLVKSSGSLIVQQPKALDAFFGKDARRIIENFDKPNCIYSDEAWENLSATNASCDRVIWLQGPHELWFEPRPGISFGRPERVFSEIFRVLKPEGLFLLVDNKARDGLTQQAAAPLHRSAPSHIQGLIEAAGLQLFMEDLQWVINPEDKGDLPTFNRKVHMRTSQFLQIYKKIA